MAAIGEPTLGLTKSGTGKLTLSGGNINFSGPVTINNGTLVLSDIGQYGGIITNNATLILNTLGSSRSFSLVRGVVGTGVVWKTGPGVVKLDFSGAGAPLSNIMSQTMPLNLAGGTIWVGGAANYVATQNFNMVRLASGYSTILASNGPLGQPVSVNIASLVRGTGSVLQVLGTGGSVIRGAPANGTNGIIAGWMLYGLNDWAMNDGTGIFTNYSAYATPAAWTKTANVNLNTNSVIAAAAMSGSTGWVNSLRFTNPGAAVLRMTNQTLWVSSGGILFGNTVGNSNNIITGGILRSGTNELLVTISKIGSGATARR